MFTPASVTTGGYGDSDNEDDDIINDQDSDDDDDGFADFDLDAMIQRGQTAGQFEDLPGETQGSDEAIDAIISTGLLPELPTDQKV